MSVHLEHLCTSFGNQVLIHQVTYGGPDQWLTRIRHRGKNTVIAVCKSQEDAAVIYDRAALESKVRGDLSG